MNEKVRKTIVYGALVIAIGWGANNILTDRVVVETNSNNTAYATVQPVIASTGVVEKTINVAEMKNRQWGEDPFRALVKSSGSKSGPASPSWKLSGIVWNSIKPLAIINGKSVTVGDKLGDAEIIEIGRKSVILERSGARITLTVSKG